MGKIKVMPDQLASQVAAGEVVERPESVVRELMDNALDAGAARLEVRVEKAGRALISVTDDGGGMSADDALLSLERHATSKLRALDGLARLRTLGFRGEALPSIASVCRMRLRTREPGALAGTLVEVEGGVIREVREEGCAPGTQVEVRDLFFNVPARRHFLKADATEFGHIEQRVRLVAAARADTGFVLWHNSRECLRLPAGQSRRERVAILLGEETAGATREVDWEERGIAVAGFATGPGWARPSRRALSFFVNRRPVDSPVLRAAVADAYLGLLDKGMSPAGVLFLEMDPADFDINIHPAKREIRFRNQGAVSAALRNALDAALARRPAVPAAPRSVVSSVPGVVPETAAGPGTGGRESAGEASHANPAHGSATGNPTGEISNIDAPKAPASPTAARLEAARLPPAESPALFPEEAPTDESAPGLESARYLGRVLGSFELFEAHDGLVLMERRSAVERIMFEWLGNRRGTPSASQNLLIPVTLELAASEIEELAPHLAALGDLGFGIEWFGSRSLLVTALPAVITIDNAPALLRLVFEAIRHAGSPKRGVLETRHLLTLVVRELAGGGRALVEFGDGPALLRRLLECEMPYCCPRGRPTLVNLGRPELKRRFGLA